MDQLKLIETSLSEVSADELNPILGNAETEFLGFSEKTRPVSREELQDCIGLLASDPALSGVLLFPAVFGESVAAWEKLPAPVAALRENATERLSTFVVRVSALRELGINSVASPFWDLVIRASAKPNSLLVKQSSNGVTVSRAPALPSLAPGIPGRDRRWLFEHLEPFSLEDVAPNITSRADAIALKAGLLQIHDYLDESHQLSQSVEGKGQHAAGDYWHAIMHRREPDYSNSKYWFRHVRTHPIFEPLATAVDQLLSERKTPAAETARQKLRAGGKWDPFAFVDFCQECERGGDAELTQIAKEIQWREMQLLLEQTYLDAVA